MNDLDLLREEIRVFNRERDWEQFHSPKNLAIGLSIESAELLERFQWMPDSTSDKLEEGQLQNLRDEIGDVLIYLVNLADKLDLDPVGCAKQKLEKNRIKYPVPLARGSARKHTDYQKDSE